MVLGRRSTQCHGIEGLPVPPYLLCSVTPLTAPPAHPTQALQTSHRPAVTPALRARRATAPPLAWKDPFLSPARGPSKPSRTREAGIQLSLPWYPSWTPLFLLLRQGSANCSPNPTDCLLFYGPKAEKGFYIKCLERIKRRMSGHVKTM